MTWTQAFGGDMFECEVFKGWTMMVNLANLSKLKISLRKLGKAQL
jgi:hypothetical protein